MTKILLALLAFTIRPKRRRNSARSRAPPVVDRQRRDDDVLRCPRNGHQPRVHQMVLMPNIVELERVTAVA